MNFIEFKICDDNKFRQLETVFNILKIEKERSIIEPEDIKWKELFGKEALSCFWWPTTKEFEKYQKLYFSTPLEKREQDERLKTPWDFVSLIDAIKNGEYALKRCIKINDNLGYLEFEPWSYPYGGSESLQELIKCFNHIIIKLKV